MNKISPRLSFRQSAFRRDPSWRRRFWKTLALVAAGAGVAAGGDKVLVVGDSLTKEYRSEFVVLYPTSPAAWDARNWIELLDARRNQQFDLGSWSVFSDLRLTGHEFNWSKPGGTVREFRNFLRQTADAEAEIKATSGGTAIWELFPDWRATFTNSTGEAQKVVLFFGGNDLALGNSDPVANPSVNGKRRQVDYETIYAGNLGAASDPEILKASIRSNLKSVIQWFRDPRTSNNGEALPPRFSGPMILCAVPHVGCTPKLQRDAGTDPARTAVLTEMIEGLNRELQEFAVSRDVGFANVYAVTKAILDPAPFQIGGVIFRKESDEDCGPRYLFSGDGFHPNTAVHAKVAQVVADAFLEKYPGMAPDLKRLSDREIITEVLGLPGDTGYVEWMTEAGVPVSLRGPLSDPDKDGVPNAMEYALAGRAPDKADPEAPFEVSLEPNPGGEGKVIAATWQPRFAGNAYCDIVPQTSVGMQSWQPVPPGSIQTLADGKRRVQLAPAGKSWFFRLSAVRP